MLLRENTGRRFKCSIAVRPSCQSLVFAPQPIGRRLTSRPRVGWQAATEPSRPPPCVNLRHFVASHTTSVSGRQDSLEGPAHRPRSGSRRFRPGLGCGGSHRATPRERSTGARARGLVSALPWILPLIRVGSSSQRRVRLSSMRFDCRKPASQIRARTFLSEIYIQISDERSRALSDEVTVTQSFGCH